MKRTREERRKLVMAGALLAVGAIVSVSGLIGGGDSAAIVDQELIPDDEEPRAWDDPGAGSRDDTATRSTLDLLAMFGSFDGADASLPNPFVGLTPPHVESNPAVVDEVSVESGSEPALPDPPAHFVALVLHTDRRATAVVDGSRVHVGDVIAAGRIVRVRADGVVVEGPWGRLGYELGDPVPFGGTPSVPADDRPAGIDATEKAAPSDPADAPLPSTELDTTSAAPTTDEELSSLVQALSGLDAAALAAMFEATAPAGSEDSSRSPP